MFVYNNKNKENTCPYGQVFFERNHIERDISAKLVGVGIVVIVDGVQ